MDTIQPKNKENFKKNGNLEKEYKELNEKFSQPTESYLKFETDKEKAVVGRVEASIDKENNVIHISIEIKLR